MREAGGGLRARDGARGVVADGATVLGAAAILTFEEPKG